MISEMCMIKPVIFENEGERIVGILHLPYSLRKGEKTAPAVTMFHGFTGHKAGAYRLFVHAARALCDAGFIVLRFDFRGSGDSDGDFEDMTVPKEVSDASRAINFLLNLPFVDPERIGIIGMSMGGRVAAIIASRDKRVKFLVLYSAALIPLKKKFLSLIKKEDRKRLEEGEAVNIMDGWYIKKQFFETLDSPVPLHILDRIKVPVLMIHGDSDEVIGLEDSIKGYEMLVKLNRKSELYIIKGGDHAFTDKKHRREVIEKTLSWLNRLCFTG